MKKSLLFLFILLPYIGIAQSLEVENPMFEISGTLENSTLEAHWDVLNTSSSAVSVKLSRELIQEIDGSRNNFCWGVQCYGFGTDVSPQPAIIEPGATESTFHGYYEHQGNLGTTEIKYCFFDEFDDSDEVCITTTFRIEEEIIGVEEFEIKNELGNVSPNPMVGLSSFSYQFNNHSNNNRVVIYNLIGAVVKEFPLIASQGVVILNGQDFETGIYLYSLIVDGQKVSTKRLVVAK